jgi:hypothetical protein
MKNNIKVKSLEYFSIHQNNADKTLLAIVEENKEYKATLYKSTEEYFAKDFEGREFLVGEINIDGNIILEKNFILIEK